MKCVLFFFFFFVQRISVRIANSNFCEDCLINVNLNHQNFPICNTVIATCTLLYYQKKKKKKKETTKKKEHTTNNIGAD